MSRPLVLLTAATLLLASCGGTQSVWKLTYDTTDPAKKSELASAAARVLERRIQGLLQETTPEHVTIDGDTLKVSIKNADAAKEINRQLLQPFTMRIMTQTDDTATADIRSDKYGAFRETGITEKSFSSVDAHASAEKGKGVVTLRFTPEGKVLLKKVFEANKGKVMGLFVRGVLMSMKTIDTTDTKESIAIDGIPSLELASAFMDDVNVGLHVTFTPEN